MLKFLFVENNTKQKRKGKEKLCIFENVLFFWVLARIKNEWDGEEYNLGKFLIF